jgi:hypothetical protein
MEAIRMDQQQGQFGQGQEQGQFGQGQEQFEQNQVQQALQSQQSAQTGQGQTQQANQSGQNWQASTGGDWPGSPTGQEGTVQSSQSGQFGQDSQSGQSGGVQVVAVRKNGDGDIVEMKLSSGQVVDYKTAQSMSKQGILEHTNVFTGRDGEEHLRSDADGDPSNNLDNMPTF